MMSDSEIFRLALCEYGISSHLYWEHIIHQVFLVWIAVPVCFRARITTFCPVCVGVGNRTEGLMYIVQEHIVLYQIKYATREIYIVFVVRDKYNDNKKSLF